MYNIVSLHWLLEEYLNVCVRYDLIHKKEICDLLEDFDLGYLEFINIVWFGQVPNLYSVGQI